MSQSGKKSKGVTGKTGAQRACGEEGVGDAGVQRGMRGGTERGSSSQAT